MKAMLTMLGILTTGSAMATDYSVGIANLGSGALGGGSALNLYATGGTGIDLVESYVLPENDFTGKRAEPLFVVINPAHTFVYAAYTGPNLPIIVGLKITSTKLVFEWQQELQTGDAGLQGTTLSAGPDYVIENTFPVGSLIVHVLNQAGTELLVDETNTGTTVLSGYVDPAIGLYYSCRSPASSDPVSAVSVYAFKAGVDVNTSTATPVAKSTSATYLRSICN